MGYIVVGASWVCPARKKTCRRRRRRRPAFGAGDGRESFVIVVVVGRVRLSRRWSLTHSLHPCRKT